MSATTKESWDNMDDGERARRLTGFEAACQALPADVFLYSCVGRAARETGFWIVARKTNEDALPYIGKANYVPKSISCKPKTADQNATVTVNGAVRSLRTAGLVASPEVVPTAFSGGRLHTALWLWRDFARKHLGAADAEHYEVDTRPSSQHYGCLKKGTAWIHGDLDLFDVIKGSPLPASLGARNERIRTETLEGQTNRYTEYARVVGNKINMLVGAPMVQHGAQAQFGDFDSEALDVFAPDGRMFALPNRMTARAWYLLRWPGRTTVAALKRGDKLFEGARHYTI
jgi:hypothetical protein